MFDAPYSHAAPSRQAGLERLAAFAPRMGADYARRRNVDFGPRDRSNVSQLSGYLRMRLVLEREAVETALAGHGAERAESFIQEVFWRTYWKGWLERRPEVWRAYRAGVDAGGAAMASDADAAARWRAAEAGETGLACFDAWARELVETGYLHNHARMWFASLWIFTFRLPWELGADFFLRHLIDGDPASNTLGWRWVAGLQTRGKRYLARADNIAIFTDGRFRPDAAALADDAPALSEPPLGPAGPTPAPTPWTFDGAVGLLLTEEDLAPETLPGLDLDRLSASAAVSAVQDRSPRPIGAAASLWSIGALEDGCTRLEAAGGPAPSRLNAKDDQAAAIRDWARRAALGRVVTPYAPQGPTREMLERARLLLAEDGVPLTYLLRDWDARAWDVADRGFFPFKKRIPELMRAAGLQRSRFAAESC
ncbi:MAG: FAD-binding domain-containing protein [Marivibrio sp.]|uniref:FAD-binding domain-containing protein n=1 Tax=Marivibrio sp. TaxID=2039719 RepID=UPI0032EBC997